MAARTDHHAPEQIPHTPPGTRTRRYVPVYVSLRGVQLLPTGSRFYPVFTSYIVWVFKQNNCTWDISGVMGFWPYLLPSGNNSILILATDRLGPSGHRRMKYKLTSVVSMAGCPPKNGKRWVLLLIYLCDNVRRLRCHRLNGCQRLWIPSKYRFGVNRSGRLPIQHNPHEGRPPVYLYTVSFPEPHGIQLHMFIVFCLMSGSGLGTKTRITSAEVLRVKVFAKHSMMATGDLEWGTRL